MQTVLDSAGRPWTHVQALGATSTCSGSTTRWPSSTTGHGPLVDELGNPITGDQLHGTIDPPSNPDHSGTADVETKVGFTVWLESARGPYVGVMARPGARSGLVERTGRTLCVDPRRPGGREHPFDIVAIVLNTPHTRWQGDDLHGRHPVLTPVMVRLDALYPHPPDVPHKVVPDGLDLVGEVPGMLSGWLRSARGAWLAVLSSLELPYADGRRHRVQLVDQVVPAHSVRLRDGSRDSHPGPDPPRPRTPESDGSP